MPLAADFLPALAEALAGAFFAGADFLPVLAAALTGAFFAGADFLLALAEALAGAFFAGADFLPALAEALAGAFFAGADFLPALAEALAGDFFADADFLLALAEALTGAFFADADFLLALAEALTGAFFAGTDFLLALAEALAGAFFAGADFLLALAEALTGAFFADADFLLALAEALAGDFFAGADFLPALAEALAGAFFAGADFLPALAEALAGAFFADADFLPALAEALTGAFFAGADFLPALAEALAGAFFADADFLLALAEALAGAFFADADFLLALAEALTGAFFAGADFLPALAEALTGAFFAGADFLLALAEALAGDFFAGADFLPALAEALAGAFFADADFLPALAEALAGAFFADADFLLALAEALAGAFFAGADFLLALAETLAGAFFAAPAPLPLLALALLFGIFDFCIISTIQNRYYQPLLQFYLLSRRNSCPRMPYARRLQQLKPFRVVEILSRAKELEAAGHSILHLEAGEPDFATAAPIVKAGQDALRQGHMKYTEPCGIPPLREALSRYYEEEYGLSISPSRILVTPGASGALLLAAALLVNPGDEMLMADPGYPCNRNFLLVTNGQSRQVPTEAAGRYQLSAALAEAHWGENTRGIMLASPANPTGAMLSREEIQALWDMAAQRRAYMVADEIYHGLSYAEPPTSILEITNQAFVIGSFSKYFGMTGWRLGWLVAPEDAVQSLERLAQNLFISMSSVAQYAALAAFRPETRAILDERRDILAQRRDFLLAALRGIGFNIPHTPAGAMYIYAGVGSFSDDSSALCETLLEEHGIAAVPGEDFGIHRASEHMRFAYTTGMEQLEQAAQRLQNFLC